MRKIMTKILSCICIVALCICIMPMNVYAKTNVPRGIYIEHFATSDDSGNMNWDISIENNNLTVNITNPQAEDGTSILLTCSCGYEDWEVFHQHTAKLTHDLYSHEQGNHSIALHKANSVSDSTVYYFVGYELCITEDTCGFYFPAGSSEKAFYKSLSKLNPKEYKGVPYGTRALKNFPKMQQIVRNITKDCTNDEQKVLAIHDWIAENISYDYVAYYSNNLYDAADPEKVFKSKRAVCSGYARLARILFGIAEIPCVNINGYISDIGEGPLIEGKTYNNINHEWNAVYVNGKWEILDITWDSQNEYYGKNDSRNKTHQPANYTYYMISPELFGANHFSMKLYAERNENYISASNGNIYRIIDPKKHTIVLHKATTTAKTFSLFDIRYIFDDLESVKYSVVGIDKGAFDSCKNLRTIDIYGVNLKKPFTKNCLKGSKVTCVNLHGKSSLVKKYKQLFSKSVCGKTVKVKC